MIVKRSRADAWKWTNDIVLELWVEPTIVHSDRWRHACWRLDLHVLTPLAHSCMRKAEPADSTQLKTFEFLGDSNEVEPRQASRSARAPISGKSRRRSEESEFDAHGTPSRPAGPSRACGAGCTEKSVMKALVSINLTLKFD